MALKISGLAKFQGVTISAINNFVGDFAQQYSSLAPPGAPVPITGLTFQQTSPPPGPFAFYDPFNTESGFPDIDTRLIDGIVGGTTVTIPLNFPSGYVWSDPTGGASNPAGGGSATITQGTFPAVYATSQEYDMTNGAFFEFMFNAATKDVACLFGVNLGDSSFSVVAGPDGSVGPDINGNYPARFNAGGFNGYTGSGGYKYTDGSYTAVPLINGTGSGATADITVTNGSVTSVTLVNPGSSYTAGDILSASYTDLGNVSGSDFGIFVDTVDGSGIIQALGALTTGTPLQPNPLDTWDTASASFSTDAYYTVPMDWRNVLIRAELTSTFMRMYADGVLVIEQPLRFTPGLFASLDFKKGTAQYPWSNDSASLQVFTSGSADPITLDFARVGAL